MREVLDDFTTKDQVEKVIFVRESICFYIEDSYFFIFHRLVAACDTPDVVAHELKSCPQVVRVASHVEYCHPGLDPGSLYESDFFQYRFISAFMNQKVRAFVRRCDFGFDSRERIVQIHETSIANMIYTYAMRNVWDFARSWRGRALIFLTIFGPATITAMADNDASGVATYAIAGAKLGYPILFLLLWTTVLLGITQEMGMRLALVTRKGLGDLIREYHGIRVSIFIFGCLLVANLGTIIVDIAAFKTTAELLHLPAIALVVGMLLVTFFFITKGNYKFTQNLMLISCLFYLAYVFSAFRSNPDWGMSLKNLTWPQGMTFGPGYWKDYLIIGLGVLGTTITPWGQFFISSFGLDKKIEVKRLHYSQMETYWGAFLTDFFSFFMIVATAATLFAHAIPLVDGAQAALAIEPFAGKLAASLFAFGIMNAGFMGIVIVGLSTTYAFSEFFGYSGSLDRSFTQSKTFYILFLLQLVVGFLVILLPGMDLFKIAIGTQILNAMALPPIFYYLIKLTSRESLMGENVNNPFQKWGAIVGTVAISIASIVAIIATVFAL